MEAAARNPHDLGAPVHLPEEYNNMWLAWYDNKGAPAFDRNAEGRLVLKAGSKSLTTYAPFMDLVVKESEVYAKCIIQGCDSPASKEGIRLTYPRVNMGNFIEHLWRSHDGVFHST